MQLLSHATISITTNRQLWHVRRIAHNFLPNLT